MSRGVLTPRVDAPINWVDPVNWLHPFNAGLSAWWLCVGGALGGSSWPDLCRRNHGTLNNLEPQSDWQSGLHRGAAGKLAYGGTDEYVSTGLSMNSLTEFTIAAWVRRSAAGSLIYIASNGANYCQIGFFSDGVLYVTPDANGSTFMTTSTNVATPLHVVYSFRGSAATAAARNRVWINGVEAAMAGSVALTSTNASAGTLDIGRRSSGGIYSVGDIDDVRVYRSRALGHEGNAQRLYEVSLRGYPGLLNRVRLPRYTEEAAAAAVFSRMVGYRASLAGCGGLAG